MRQAAVTLPTGPESITAGWLTGVLGGARVASVSVDEIGAGRGFVGRLFRCHIDYETGHEGPATLVAKFASNNPLQRALFQEFGLYEREVRFYRDLAAETPAPVPRCYFAAVQPDSGEFAVLLEDLAPAAPGDPLAGCTLEQASDALRLLAQMHLRWWQSQQLAEPPAIPGPNVEPLRRRVEATYEEAWSEFARLYGNHLPQALLRLGERLGEHLPHILDRLASPPWTLVHGDYQLNNIFYDPDGGIRAVADWQVIVRARGAMDISHFLVRSLDPASRRAGEARLVGEYHAQLVAGGVTAYSRRDCWDDYRLSALSQFGLGIVLAHALASGLPNRDDEERLESIAAVVGARLVAALVDLRPLEVLEGRRFWGRLRRLLP